ncbi:MAG: hypothetical protein H0X17_05145, partial [Deltaproteobacteria bacterium]|nr:hypothetical protein [Deltaproteobacteria bacterium]
MPGGAGAGGGGGENTPGRAGSGFVDGGAMSAGWVTGVEEVAGSDEAGAGVVPPGIRG